MLDKEFLDDLRAEFPAFYDRVHADAMREASRLRAEAGGDVDRALMRARVSGAANIWWPYVKGAVPLVGDERPAMEAFTKLVLTVDHVVGYQPPDMETARRQVVHVLENTMDTERLLKLLNRKDEKNDEAAAAGIIASTTAFLAPLNLLRRMRKGARFVPAPVRVAIGAAIVVTVLSVPLMAGFSAGTQAERAARNFGEMPAKEKA